MVDSDVAASAWGETSELTPKDGADATLTRLYAVVGQLAATAKKRGLDGKLRKLPPPRIGSPEAQRYQKMIATIDATEAGSGGGVPLPLRAALWEVTIAGSPRRDPPLPKAVSWITDQGVTSGGDFVVGDGADGRVYRLFESDKVPPDDELPFASAVTGSGLPSPQAKSVHKKLAWAIGILAAVVFLAGGAMSVWSGRSMSGARNILNTSTPALQQELLANVAAICAEDYKAFPIGTQSAVCNKLLKDNKLPEKDPGTGSLNYPNPANAASVLVDARGCVSKPTLPDGCNTIWRAAMKTDQDQTWKASLFGFLHNMSAYLTGTDPSAGSTTILVPFLFLLIGIAGLIIGLGLGTKQRVAGVWIDTRNRVSLARAQVTLWTAVALAGYAVLALFNIGFAGIVGSAADMAKFAAFPAMPASIAAALGIAAASPMISALILPTKDTPEKTGLTIRGSDGDLRSRGAPFFGAESEGLEKRESPRLASIADIFMGEEKANADTVDVSRLQNVVITVTLVLGFFSYLVAMTSSITATTMLSTNGAIFSSLPELGATFTSLLLVSHATYLVAKAHDAKNPAAPQTSD